jgi:hypothetical protein
MIITTQNLKINHAVVTRNSLNGRISIQKFEEKKMLKKITQLKHETGLNGKCRILYDEL